MSESVGVRIEVEPTYLAAQSDPFERRFVFAYRIEITNTGDEAVQLMTRRWRIVDAHGDEHVVEGEGVVGQQPHLEPGETFEYASFCPLRTPWGTMEGAYTFRRSADGGEFEAPVGRFYLVSSEETPRR